MSVITKRPCPPSTLHPTSLMTGVLRFFSYGSMALLVNFSHLHDHHHMTSEELASPGDTDTNTAIYLKIPNIDTDTCKMRYIGVSKQRHLSIAIETILFIF
jgi:hypothetical protein